MSYSFPPEIHDRIIDHLHDEPTALGACCLVSKSWIPRTRMYLFADVRFTCEFRIGRWVKAFPDPLNSPAHYTRILTILSHLATTTTVAADVGPWIRAFHNIVHLRVSNRSLFPFHGLSPATRSLRLEYPKARTSEILDFMCSFPLLEDFALHFGPGSDTDDWIPTSTLPRLTGSLELDGLEGGIGNIMRRLLDLQGGLHFTKIALVWMDETDFKLAVDLISRCSRTVQSLDLSEHIHSTEDHLDPATTVVDISAATKLKRLVFRCSRPNVQWIAMTLQTINSKDLRQIIVLLKSYSFNHAVHEMICQEWGVLDRLLIQFWISNSIRPKVICGPRLGRKDMGTYLSRLLPEMTRRGLVDLVEYRN